jgi:SAM-dependent methyltransferase
MRTLELLLEAPPLYLLSQSILGAKKARKHCIKDYVRPRAGMRVLDIGCGPGYLVEYLAGASYYGLDVNPRYITYAKKKYGSRGNFYCQTFDDAVAKELGSFDLILMMGVLHHLDDKQAAATIELCKQVLKSEGSLITLDPYRRPDESFIAEFLLNRDRGRFIRNRSDYLRLVSSSFTNVALHTRLDLFFVPYTALVMVCRP